MYTYNLQPAIVAFLVLGKIVLSNHKRVANTWWGASFMFGIAIETNRIF